MKATHRFDVAPTIPASLHGLSRLAVNLRWTWDVDTQRHFERLDPEAWRATKFTGEFLIDDPDGIVEEVRFVAGAECHSLLGTVAPWVREPVHAWLEAPWAHRRVFRYSVRGSDRATAEIIRLAD